MEKNNNLEVPIWSSCNNFAIETSSSNCSDQFPNCFLNPNWENPTDQNDPFESALSSIVSSPNANAIHNNTSDPIIIRELIGRLGSICNSPQSYINNSSNSTNTSCYTTPLNSPPKLNTLIADSQIRHVAPLPSDPGFVERAARFSCFGSKFMNGSINGSQQSGNCEKKMSVMSVAESADFGESREESSLSEPITGGDLNVRIQNSCTDSNPRKRKAIPRGRAKQSLSSSPAASTVKVAAEKDESSAKKGKSDGANGNDKAKAKEEESKNQKQSKDSSKPPEPPKDYIHVRARRGQATDSHSLAERVRREKISERMKFLQDLVPGCNKVTGKAVMLDEIINYVQSLQRQVEFLSMKLATVNPRLDFNVDALAKDVFQPRGPFPPHNIYPLDSPAALALPYHSQQAMPVSSTIGISSNAETQFPVNPLNALLLQQQTQSMQLPPLDGFCDPATHQVSAFWEDDIQSVVQLGFGQTQQHVFANPDSLAGTQMKAEQ